MPKQSSTYHIIGGGIAGLTTAKILKKQNPHNKIILYEAAAHLGGRAYSFWDKRLEKQIDNAPHVLIGANRAAQNTIKNITFSEMPHFWHEGKTSKNFLRWPKHVFLSIFNTKAELVPFSMYWKLLCKLFPFFPSRLKIWFSRGDLSETIISPLSKNIDEIKVGWLLRNIETQDDFVSALNFNKGKIILDKKDKVISAIDADNYSKIFGGYRFEFNEITNIFFRTSQTLRFSEKSDFIATPALTAEWILSDKEITAVTISDSSSLPQSDEELARKIWLEIRGLKGILPAFMPPYRVIRHKKATLRQNKINNQNRPSSAKTQYKNLRIAGDWTMKDYPCCIETAILSARRAAKF